MNKLGFYEGKRKYYQYRCLLKLPRFFAYHHTPALNSLNHKFIFINLDMIHCGNYANIVIQI